MIHAQPIRSLLVSVDLDANPEALLRDAGEFALACGASLHLMHAVDEGLLSAERGNWLDMQKRLHEKRVALHSTLERVLPAEVEVRSARVVIGSPGDMIPAQAHERDVDLIVIGPHRPHSIGDRYLGSTAERLVRSATVPCLILNSRMNLPVRRILVPADFSAPSRKALRRGVLWVRALSRRGPVEIDFVHVLGPGAERLSTRSIDGVRSDLDREVRDARAAAEVRVEVNVHVLPGDDPGGELLRFAEENSVDLVVMGTRGDSVLMRGLVGSVSSGMLRRSTIPLLLVPPLALVEGEVIETSTMNREPFPYPLVY